MEIGLKQKIIIFGTMAVIFAGSLFIKNVVLSDGDSDSGNENGIVIESNDGETLPDDDTETTAEEPILFIVDVEGAVVYPGIVKIEEGSRVYEAIDLAGGMLETADSRSVNLAEVVEDGSVIYIPFEGEEVDNNYSGTGADSGGLININKADTKTLMTLPGIGEAYAAAIIDYREKNGKFKSKEDLKKVSGIGDAKFAKLEDLICV